MAKRKIKMAIKKFNITLDEEVVEKAKKKLEPYCGKLSPVINNLLKKWLEEEKEL